MKHSYLEAQDTYDPSVTGAYSPVVTLYTDLGCSYLDYHKELQVQLGCS